MTATSANQPTNKQRTNVSEIRRGTNAEGRRVDSEEMDTRRVKGIYDCKPYTIDRGTKGTNIITYMVRCITYQLTLTAAEGGIPRELLCQGRMLFFIGLESVGQGLL